MARTVDSTLDIPKEQAFSISEVCSITPDSAGGLVKIYTALNTFYEQLRGNIVNDVGDPILSSTARDIAYYRPRPMGYSGLTDDTVDIYLDLETTGGAATVAFRQNSTTSSWTGTQGTRGWVQTSTSPACKDSSDYIDIEVEITAAAGTCMVYGISAGYTRGKSALTAVSAGSYGYAHSGIVPLDLAHVAGEAPMSVARILDAHALAKYLFLSRPGQIVTTANPRYDAEGLWFTAPAPLTRTGTVDARFYVRHDGTGTETITISGAGDSDSLTASSSERWSNALELTVPAPTSTLELPLWHLFYLDPDGADIYGVSGWWEDTSYD